MNHRFYILFIVLALSLAGCAHNIIDVPAPTVSNVHDYSWNADSGAVAYTTETQNVQSPLTVSFVRIDQNGNYDLIERLNGSVADTLHLVSTAGALTVKGLGEHSVISIPHGYTMAATKIDSTVIYPNFTKVFAFGSANMIAVTSTPKLFFSTNSGEVWLAPSASATFNTGEYPTVFAYGKYLSNAVVAVGTSAGRIMISSDNGNHWTALGSSLSLPVRAMTSDAGVIYAAIGSSSGTAGSIYQLSSLGLQRVIDLPFDSGITTSLAVTTMLNNQQMKYFVVGAQGSGLWYAGLKSDTIWKRFSGKGAPGVGENIQCILRDTFSTMMVGSGLGLYEFTGSDSSWHRVSGVSGSIIGGAFDLNKDRFIVYTSYQSLYQFQINSSSASALPPIANNKSPLTGIAVTGLGTVLASTSDSGLFTLSDQQVWKPSGNGIPKDVRIARSLLPENFVMLSPGANGFSVGSTWDAGILHTDSTDHHLTAKIVEYFDKLSIDSTLSYSNVFMIDYSVADPALLTAPSWTVYYALHQGPVLVSQTQNGALISKTYRSK